MLKLSDRTITYLISIGDLSLDQHSRNLPWGSKFKVDDFSNTHIKGVQAGKLCNIPVRILQRSLLAFGVVPVCSPLINNCPETIYKIDDIRRSAGKVPYDSAPNPDTISGTIEDLTPITKIINHYKMSKSNFTRAFIQTHLVRAFGIGKELFLTANDFALIDGILKKNLTIPMADRLLKSHAYAKALAEEGRLSRSKNLPPELDSIKFVTRASLKKFLKTRPLRPDN